MKLHGHYLGVENLVMNDPLEFETDEEEDTRISGHKVDSCCGNYCLYGPVFPWLCCGWVFMPRLPQTPAEREMVNAAIALGQEMYDRSFDMETEIHKELLPLITFADIEQMRYDISCKIEILEYFSPLYGNFYAPGPLYIYPEDDEETYNWNRQWNGILWAAMLRKDLASAFDGRE
jgi:hypothetical protein